jgi:Spy/CpxP family protein refolding chaperone
MGNCEVAKDSRPTQAHNPLIPFYFHAFLETPLSIAISWHASCFYLRLNSTHSPRDRVGGMTMKKTVVVIGVVGAMALGAATAFAWGPGGGRGMGRGYGYGPGQGYGVGPAVTAPTLSAEQVSKLQKLQADRYAETAEVRTEMVTKRTELQALFRAPALDQAKIQAKQQEIAALQSQLSEKSLAARTAMAEVLTPEQRAQLPAYGAGFGHGGKGMARASGRDGSAESPRRVNIPPSGDIALPLATRGVG